MNAAPRIARKEKTPGSPQFVQTAKALLLRRRTKEAIHLLRRGLNLDPNCHEAALLLAKALIALKRLAEAQDVLDKLVSRHPEQEPYTLLAQVCLARHEYEHAALVTEEARAHFPHDKLFERLDRMARAQRDKTITSPPPTFIDQSTFPPPIPEDDEEEDDDPYGLDEATKPIEQNHAALTSDSSPPGSFALRDPDPTPKIPQPLAALRSAEHDLLSRNDGADPARQARSSAPDIISAVKQYAASRSVEGRLSEERQLHFSQIRTLPMPAKQLQQSRIKDAAPAEVCIQLPIQEMPLHPAESSVNEELATAYYHQAAAANPADEELATAYYHHQASAGPAEEELATAHYSRAGSALHGLLAPPPLVLAANEEIDPHQPLLSDDPLASRVKKPSRIVWPMLNVSEEAVLADDPAAAVAQKPQQLAVELRQRTFLPSILTPLRSIRQSLLSLPHRRQLVSRLLKLPAVRRQLRGSWLLFVIIALVSITAGILAGFAVRHHLEAKNLVNSARQLSEGGTVQDLKAALHKLRDAADIKGRTAQIVALAAAIHSRLAYEYSESDLKHIESLVEESLRLEARQDPQAAEHLAVAQAYLSLGKRPLTETIGILFQQIEAFPTNQRLYLLYAMALAENGELKLADGVLERLNLDNPQVLRAKAMVRWREKKVPEARLLLQASQRAGLSAAQARLDLAAFQLDDSRTDPAQADQLHALARATALPTAQRAWAYLLAALLYQKTSREPLARADLDQALKLHPAGNPAFCYRAAQLLLAENRLAMALDEISKAMTIAPRNSRYTTLSATIKLAMDQPHQAIEELNALDELGQDGRLLLAEAYLSARDPASAIAQLRQLNDRAAPRHKLLLARVLLARHEPYRALQTVQDLDSSSRYIARLELIRGLAARELGNVDEAMHSFQRALERQPEMPEALLQLGYLAQEQQKGNRARALFARTVKKNPYLTEARLALGQICLQLGEHAEAQQQFEKILALDSTNLAALLGRASASVETASPDAVLFLHALMTRGHRLSAELLSARLAMKKGSENNVSGWLSSLLEKPLPDEERALAQLWLAQTLVKEGDQATGTALYQQLVDDNLHLPQAALGLSEIYLSQGQAKLALQHGRAALQVLSEKIYPRALKIKIKLQLARCRQATRNYGAAIADLEDVLDLQQKNVAARIELARIYDLLNKPVRGVQYLVQAMEHDQSNREAHAELRRICDHTSALPACQGKP